MIQAFLNGKTTDSRNNGVTFLLHGFEILVFFGVVLIGGSFVIFVKRVINYVDFTERNVIFLVD